MKDKPVIILVISAASFPKFNFFNLSENGANKLLASKSPQQAAEIIKQWATEEGA